MAIAVTREGWPWWLSVILCLLTGAVIGTVIGLLVARLGIPSFVVTLALFLGLQGVLLKLIGEGGTIAVRDKVLLAINNDNMPVWLGWVLFAVVVGAYALVSLRRATARRAGGLQSEGYSVIVAKVVVLAVLLGAVTFYLSRERSRNPAVASIKGVPEVVLLLLVLLVGLNFMLGRTAFGRHVYAVGGNAEAARRAGINVKRVKLACFLFGSTLAAVGGILHRQPGQLDLAHQRWRGDPAVRGGRRGDRRHQPLRRQGQDPRRGARRPGDRGDHQRDGAAQPAVQRGLHGDRRGAAHRRQRGRAVPAAGGLDRPV